MNKLTKFWFTFEEIGRPDPINLGCGVTAISLQNAMILMNQYIFIDQEMPNILNIIENVNINELDRMHVVPNIGDMNIEGVWFPQAY